ncbi:MAG TPA: class I tRNA ligase family protein, partial [Alphaproteobacteria bacterium]|nr:class I tRNA ligase family protein [Alphaproteobacteria bacterium]
TVDGEKMSKSLGNFLLVHDLIETYPGEALRLTLLSAHYRQPLDWSEDKVQQSRKQLDRFYTRLDEMAEMDAVETDVPQGVLDALCDDLNTPQAMAEMNALLKKENSPELKGEILAAGNLLGILQQNPQEWLGFSGDVESGDNDSIEVLLQERAVAKVEKNFARADEIRDQLTAMGIEILDTSEGTKWRKIS